MSQLILSGRQLRLKLFQVGTEVTCTLSMAIKNESSCHKECKVVNIIPVPDQDKKVKSWEVGGEGGSVWFLFFSSVPDIQGKESILRNQNFVVSVIFFIVFLFTKTLEFVIAELEHQTEVHCGMTTLFARLEQDMSANENVYVPKKSSGRNSPELLLLKDCFI